MVFEKNHNIISTKQYYILCYKSKKKHIVVYDLYEN